MFLNEKGMVHQWRIEYDVLKLQEAAQQVYTLVIPTEICIVIREFNKFKQEAIHLLIQGILLSINIIY